VRPSAQTDRPARAYTNTHPFPTSSWAAAKVMDMPRHRTARITLGAALLALLILVELLIGVYSYGSIAVASGDSEWVRHTHEVLEALQELRLEMQGVESSYRRFVITDDETSLLPYRVGLARSDYELYQIRQLTADNPAQRDRIPALAGLVQRNRQNGESIIALRRTQGFAPAAAWLRGPEGPQLMQDVQDLVNRMGAEELGMLGERAARSRRSLQHSQWVILVGIPFCLLVAVAAAWYVQRDSRRRTRAESLLFDEKERARITLDSIGDGVVCTDPSGRITFLNEVAAGMAGWARAAALGRSVPEVFRIVDVAGRRAMPSPTASAIAQNEVTHLLSTCVLLRPDGTETAIEDSAAPLHDDRGAVTGAVMVFRDVSAAQAQALRMSYLAQHDVVTDLPNRISLNDRLNRALSLARRRQTRLAVLFLDLDRFKTVNDSLGHAIGDALLQSVAQRLLGCVRDPDTVSRQGGDEFVVLLSEVARIMDAAICAEKILLALSAPHTIEGHELHVSASLGIATFPNDGDDVETLIKNADFAMYFAKNSGRNNYQFYSTELNTLAVEHQYLEDGLRHAQERKEFFLNFQPIVDLQSGVVVAAEVLIRWQHPQRGVVAPAQFVPIAEESALIVPIGRWVLNAACRQAQAWHAQLLPPLRIAVNISAVELRSRGFAAGVAAILAETGLDPACLELELTETYLMQDASATGSVLRELKDLGVGLALDDFGTGYSSLSYLKRFPIDTVKIDQSFVRELTTDAGNAGIVKAVVGMGRSLDIRVVAEGVETAEQLAFLRETGCAEGQGYLFSRPVAAPDLTRFLEARQDPALSV